MTRTKRLTEEESLYLLPLTPKGTKGPVHKSSTPAQLEARLHRLQQHAHLLNAKEALDRNGVRLAEMITEQEKLTKQVGAIEEKIVELSRQILSQKETHLKNVQKPKK